MEQRLKKCYAGFLAFLLCFPSAVWFGRHIHSDLFACLNFCVMVLFATTLDTMLYANRSRPEALQFIWAGTLFLCLGAILTSLHPSSLTVYFIDWLAKR